MAGRTVLPVTALVVAFVGLAACGGQARDPRPAEGSWFADVQAVGEHGHSGFAVVSLWPDGGGTRANVTLTGSSPGGNHPWHVHEGQCGAEGPIVGDASRYPLLRPDQTGNASATTTLDAFLDPDGEYHVNIHQSAEDDTVVGCGNLISNR